ncbi:hypothetical protein [Streptosporangium vulgare]|uniref:Uncharacterized protein n=1 Tax=Streptosporangium vulgare TaxID=46190 RepID=A0ABV5TPS6_9ACTN
MAHLGFGHGARYRVGAPLVRIELPVVFSQPAARFPTLRPGCAPREPTFDTHMPTGGLSALPVSRYV